MNSESHGGARKLSHIFEFPCHFSTIRNVTKDPIKLRILLHVVPNEGAHGMTCSLRVPIPVVLVSDDRVGFRRMIGQYFGQQFSILL